MKHTVKKLDLMDVINRRRNLHGNDFDLFLSLNDYEILEKKEIYKTYGQQIPEEIGFVPVFKVNIIQLEKLYIKRLNSKSYEKHFKKFCNLNDDDFDLEFQIFIEKNGLIEHWRSFENEILLDIARKWSKKYHISI